MTDAVPRREAQRLTRRIVRMRAHLARLRKRAPLATRALGGIEHALMSSIAACLAWMPTQLFGLREGFWAAITAIAVVQTEFGATRSTGRDQFTGAAIGGVVGVGVTVALGTSLPCYALAVTIAVTCAWLINVATAARLAGITATIIMLVPHQSSAERMMAARVGEVGWGVVTAITVVWLATRLLPQRAKRV